MSSADYWPELSKPGGLEQLEKEGGSPGRISQQTLTQDFNSIRAMQKLSTDVAQLTQMPSTGGFHGAQNGALAHKRDSKACIPAYNIKTVYSQQVNPFFSPRTLAEKQQEQSIRGQRSATKLPPIDREAGRAEAGSRQLSTPPKEEPASKTPGKAPAKTPMDSKATLSSKPSETHVASHKTISEIYIDPEELAEKTELRDLLSQLQQEKLPGAVKTKWALGYKLSLDQAILDALSREELVAEKVRTKGRFQIEAQTNAGNWMRDRSWIHLANPGLKNAEMAREEVDLRLLKKRQQQKII